MKVPPATDGLLLSCGSVGIGGPPFASMISRVDGESLDCLCWRRIKNRAAMVPIRIPATRHPIATPATAPLESPSGERLGLLNWCQFHFVTVLATEATAEEEVAIVEEAALVCVVAWASGCPTKIGSERHARDEENP